MIKNEKNTAEKVYATLLLLVPVFSQYQYGALDLDVILMSAFALYAILTRTSIFILTANKRIGIILGYIFAVTTLNLLFGTKYSSNFDIIFRTGKYCLYLFVAFFLGNELLTYKGIMRAYRIIAMAATIYIIIQTLVYYGAGITLPNKIGGSSHDASATVGRLRAFYSEPAAFSYAIIPFIICSLFGKPYLEKKESNLFDALFVSIGIILSTSGQGIIATAAVWGVWFVAEFLKGNFQKTRNIFLVVCAIAAVVVLYQTGILKFALDRAGNTSESGAISARLSGYETLKVLSPLQLLFGAGYGNYVVENSYQLDVYYDVVNYSSLAQFLFTQGIFGTTLWIAFFVYVFRAGTACSKALIFAMTILSVSGCPLIGIVAPIWLTLMCVQLPEGQFSRSQEDLPTEL